MEGLAEERRDAPADLPGFVLSSGFWPEDLSDGPRDAVWYVAQQPDPAPEMTAG